MFDPGYYTSVVHHARTGRTGVPRVVQDGRAWPGSSNRVMYIRALAPAPGPGSCSDPGSGRGVLDLVVVSGIWILAPESQKSDDLA